MIQKAPLSYLDAFHNENTESDGHCVVYATIKENGTEDTVTVCGGSKRYRHLYTSSTNAIEVYFNEQTSHEGDVSYFVMEYGGMLQNIGHMNIFFLVLGAGLWSIHVPRIKDEMCFSCSSEMDVSTHKYTYFLFLGFLAIGCVDPPIPAHAVLNREGDHATIVCPHPSDVTWEVICHDGQWVGTYGNCSTGMWWHCFFLLKSEWFNLSFMKTDIYLLTIQ